ncbi:flagellar biosynthesis protein FlhF [Metabacillus iocasae]|uniref:Flagellar biosynthesis protein FlhF n=1 Tax=Priestia iocasae TaxID=2291674 RepID=A0ABS2QRP2_9BACI|nr:flagellar biosynthesis protein FlhF [Metabacillus iocasae]MBM7701883.1 flagellar biosynthesis protein FlhF [Metabacillus iocasae]
MKVKKYVAHTMPEAMKMIRAELGDNAVILNSKAIQTGGFLGLFTKKKIEVIAAIDVVEKPKPKKQKIKIEEPIVEGEKSGVRHEELDKQIKELKALVTDLTSTELRSVEHYPQEVKSVLAQLTRQEVDNGLLEELTPELLKYYYTKEHESDFALKAWVKQWLVRKLEDYQAEGIIFEKKYINVVGPTGVGKTTTLAKLAAKCVIEHKKSVAFITTDTYRIAAIDQLKTYANILNAPIEVCYNSEDVQRAMQSFASYDTVFIDTAGRNFRERKYVKDLQEMISFDDQIQTFLVLAMTAKLTDMQAIYKQFSMIPIDSFIFTKVDETETYGNAINMMLACQKGVSYITYGQNVPDDLAKADINKITNDVIGEN